MLTTKGKFTVTVKGGKVITYEDDEFGVAQTLFEEEICEATGRSFMISPLVGRGITNHVSLVNRLKELSEEGEELYDTYERVISSIRAEYADAVDKKQAITWMSSLDGKSEGLVAFDDDAQLAFLIAKYPKGKIFDTGFYLTTNRKIKSDYSSLITEILEISQDSEVVEEEEVKPTTSLPAAATSSLMEEAPSSGEKTGEDDYPTDDDFKPDEFLKTYFGSNFNSPLIKEKLDALMFPVPKETLVRMVTNAGLAAVNKSFPRTSMAANAFVDKTIENLTAEGFTLPYCPKRIIAGMMLQKKGQLRRVVPTNSFRFT